MNPTSPDQPSQGADAPVAPAHTGTELEPVMREIWEKNRGFILSVCGAILLGIVGREGWEYYGRSRDDSVKAEYAAAGSDEAALVRFAAANDAHPLGAAALLRVADAKFEKGDFAGAAEQYRKAAARLKLDVLVGRARLGEALSKMSAGDQAGADSALKAIGADATMTAGTRAEALFTSATMANDAGRTEEAMKTLDSISKMSDAGIWADRAAGLRAEISLKAKPAGETLLSIKK